MKMRLPGRKIASVSVFSVAFGFVEAAVVVYLRSLYYPDGFAFPLKWMSSAHVGVELARELSTILMLVSIGALAGKSRWSKFAFFCIAFAVWDIFYYVWLKILLNWPASLFDWDILFLIPIPWIGPVIAPVLVSVLLVLAGLVILHEERDGRVFSPPAGSWLLASAGVLVILISFVLDTPATLHGKLPQPYPYWLLTIGLALLCFSLWRSKRRVRGLNKS